jgi:hypothetical protein
MTNQNTSKYIKIFSCKICDFECSKKGDYNRHTLSDKHTIRSNTNKITSITSKIYTCECNKIYKHASSLWNHKKKCNFTDVKTSNDKELKELKELKEQMNKITTQNKELHQAVMELSKEKSIVTNNTTNNTNNKTFNLQFFLNEECKDALNIEEFVSSIQVSLKELEETGRLGYAEGITKIILKNLKSLETCKRPIHCSDLKRETIYIKDKNQWEKDNEEKTKLTKAIQKVAHKNIEQISVWSKEHPEHMDYNSRYNEKYMKIIGQSMSGATYEESDKNYKKIARNVTKAVIIEKNV